MATDLMVEMGLVVNVKLWSNTSAQGENSSHMLEILRKVKKNLKKKKSVTEAFILYLHLFFVTLESDFFLS